MIRTPEEITNTADVLDTRKILPRIVYLEDLLEDTEDEAKQEELKALHSLVDQVARVCGEGPHLIRDSYFEQYARELAADRGLMDAIPRNWEWPLIFIDWPAAAEDLKLDYAAVGFDGVT
jgi:hypothetical protein